MNDGTEVVYVEANFKKTEKIIGDEMYRKYKIDIYELKQGGTSHNPYFQIQTITGTYCSCQYKKVTYVHPVPYSNFLLFFK